MKLSTCMSKYAPTFTYGQRLYVVAERMRLQAAGMGFLQRVTGQSRVAIPSIERNQRQGGVIGYIIYIYYMILEAGPGVDLGPGSQCSI